MSTPTLEQVDAWLANPPPGMNVVALRQYRDQLTAQQPPAVQAAPAQAMPAQQGAPWAGAPQQPAPPPPASTPPWAQGPAPAQQQGAPWAGGQQLPAGASPMPVAIDQLRSQLGEVPPEVQAAYGQAQASAEAQAQDEAKAKAEAKAAKAAERKAAKEAKAAAAAMGSTMSTDEGGKNRRNALFVACVERGVPFEALDSVFAQAMRVGAL